MSLTNPLRSELPLRAVCVLAFAFACAGCLAPDAAPPDDRDDAFIVDGKADTGGITEGSPQALGVLEVVNELSETALTDDVGLVELVANLIVTYRDGTDEEPGKPFESLAELDAVPFVGPVAFEALLGYAIAHGYVSNACESDGDCATGVCVLGACSAIADELVTGTPLKFQRADIAVDDDGTAWFMGSDHSLTHSAKGKLYRNSGSGWVLAKSLSDHSDLIVLPRPGGGATVIAARSSAFWVSGHTRCSGTNGRPEQFAAAYSAAGALHIVYSSGKRLSVCNASTGAHDLVTASLSIFTDRFALRFDQADRPQVLAQESRRLKRYRVHLDKWEKSHLHTNAGTHDGGMQVTGDGLSTHVWFATRSFESSPSVGTLHVTYLHITDDGVEHAAAVPVPQAFGAHLAGPASVAEGSAYAVVVGRVSDGRRPAYAIRAAPGGHTETSEISNLEFSGTGAYSLAAGPGGTLYQATGNGLVRTITPL